MTEGVKSEVNWRKGRKEGRKEGMAGGVKSEGHHFGREEGGKREEESKWRRKTRKYITKRSILCEERRRKGEKRGR